jgi:hypothetical protein
MLPSAAEIAPQWLRPTAQRKAVFRVFRNDDGRWCANRADGMAGGTFFEQEAAIRFARRESAGAPVLVLRIEMDAPHAAR